MENKCAKGICKKKKLKRKILGAFHLVETENRSQKRVFHFILNIFQIK